MEFQCFVACLLVVFQVHSTLAGDFPEYETERTITECDKELGKLLCADEFKSKIKDCADLMPEEEKPLYFKCGESLVKTEKWMPLLDAVCSQEEQVKAAYEVIDCWDHEMHEKVDEFSDDKVYPVDHFKCKKKILEEAIDKASCSCKMEKINLCKKCKCEVANLG